jgi:heptosyltransferase-2
LKKILIIQTAFIGDVILATPVLEALHAEFPEARIDMLVRKGNQTLFQGPPFLKTVFVWDKQLGKYKNLLLLLIAIRRQKYDLVIIANALQLRVS